jgi:hypothetical protein
MKRSAVLCQIALLGLVGCTVQTTPVADSSPRPEAVSVVQAPTEDSTSATLVSLKVPNMH